MDPLTIGLIGGGASLLGSIFSSSTSASNTQAQIAAQQQMLGQTEQFNAQQADINRQFEANMRGTAYQTTVADMKSAGINPMSLASGAGMSNAGVGGAQASIGTPGVPMPSKTSPLAAIGDVVPKIVSSAAGVQGLEKQAEETREQKAVADSAEANAEKDRLGLTQARYDALKAGYRYAMRPEDIRTAATAGEKYGEYGKNVGQPLEQGANILGRTVQKIVDGVTGPTGKALWDKARGTFSLPSFYDRTGMDAHPGY